MSDRAFFSLVALAVVAMVALSMVFPQGEGRRSPGPFGHATTAELKARQPKLRPAIAPAPKAPGIL
jgi:hypothetical protein